jgi:hypothetical protein
MREQLGSRLEDVDGRRVMNIEDLVNPAPELRPRFENDHNGEKINGDERTNH